MNTDRIYEILWNDAATSASVMAVIPCNALKYVTTSRGCYIVNCNENSYLRGDVGHWLFLRIHSSGRRDDDTRLEVFDALGAKAYNDEINMFMRQFDHCSINYEHISNVNCGFYALVYSYYRCRKFTPSSILNILKGIGDVEKHCLLLYSAKKAHNC